MSCCAKCAARVPMRSFADDEWDWVLDFVGNGGDSAQGHIRSTRKVVVSDWPARGGAGTREFARRHRMSIGTIVSDAHIVVQYLRGGRLGSVEESFVARLSQVTGLSLPARRWSSCACATWWRGCGARRTRRDSIPRWMGSRLPLSGELAAALRARLGEAARGVHPRRGDAGAAGRFSMCRQRGRRYRGRMIFSSSG